MQNQKLVLMVAAAGGACSVAFAGPQRQAPVVQPSIIPPQLIMPLQVARARMVNGKLEREGPWMPYVGAGAGPDVPTVPVFDAFEPDSAGAPTNFCTSGCAQNGACPAAPAGSRWYFGTGFINPNSTNDMTVGAGFNNAMCAGTEFAWFWGGTTARHCVIAVATAEDFNDCPSGMTGAANYFPGVMFDFGMITGGGGHYTNADLTPNSLFFTMPADGSGAYTIQLQTDDPANPGQFVLDPTPGNQPFLWGTGDGETPPDGRVGHNGPSEWFDNTAPFGPPYASTECFDLTQTAICPSPLCSSIMFLTEPGAVTGACCIPSAPCQVVTAAACAALNGVYQGDNTSCALCGSTCYPNCDNSTTVPCLNVQDFGCFLNRFAAGDSYANCDNSTTPPVLNVQDFGCYLNQFASGCSSC